MATVSELQSLTLTANVSAAGSAIGNVVFYDQGTRIGSGYIDDAGKASLTCTFANFGTHLLTASYQGVQDFAPSVSSAVAENVLRTPRQLCFTQSKTWVPAGTSFNLAVSVMDCQSTVISNNTASVALAIVAGYGGGALAGTLTAQASNGVATFNNLTFTKPGTYTIRATNGSGLSGDLTSIVVTPPATHIGFVVATSSATIAGQVLAPVTVQFLDSANHVVPLNVPISVALSKSNGATLAGTTTVAAHDGTAVFSNLSMTQAGTYTLTATSSSFSVVSKFFTIVPEASTSRLVIAAQPSGVPLDAALPAITVNIQDQYNNIVTQDSSTLTLAIATGPTGAALKGNLTAKANKGVAKFTGITPLQAGEYTLRISDGTMTPVVSSSFTVRYVPTKLVVAPRSAAASGLNLPSFAISVADAKGRTVTTSSAVIVLSATVPSGAIIHGTLSATASHGVATFAGLSVDAHGTYTFKIASDPLTSATLKLTI